MSRYRPNGKQVLRNDVHFADACDYEAAQEIADAMNARQSDVVPISEHVEMFDTHDDSKPYRQSRPGKRHLVSRQGDEYACSCGSRWPVNEDDTHP